MPEGAARAEAATKNLMKLNVLYHNHTEFLTSYMEVVLSLIHISPAPMASLWSRTTRAWPRRLASS